MRTNGIHAASLGVALLAAGCYSGLDPDAGAASQGASADGGDAGEGGSGGDESADDGGGSDPPPEGFEPMPGPMRRLTLAQYSNSVADIFGPEIEVRTPLEVDESTGRFLSIGAAQVGTSETGVAQYRDAAFDIAAQVFEGRERYPLLAQCAPSSAEDACVTEAIAHYGRLLWRRPLRSEEVQRYAALVEAPYEEGVNPELGLQYAIAGLLESPNFIYVIQIGEDDPASDFTRYTSLEIASRLSFFLWDSTPDEALLDAAATGTLVERDAIAQQTRRMLDAPRAASLATRFFGEAWNVRGLDINAKNIEAFPEWTQARVDAYRAEFDAVLEDLVTRDGDLREIFDGKETFVDPLLAELYGVPEPSSPDVPVMLDGKRWGLLTSGAVLAANSPSVRTSPTVRGNFLYERLLCQEVPPPPDNVDDVLPDDEPGAPPTTTREKLERHRADPVCAACHALIDPMGLALEHYDAIGGFREQDNGFDVDASATFEDKSFDGVADLATFLADDPRAIDCIAQNLLSYATGIQVTPEEAETTQALSAAFVEAEHSFVELIVELVTHPSFRYLEPQEEE